MDDRARMDSEWNGNDQHKTVKNHQLCHCIISSKDTGNVFAGDYLHYVQQTPEAWAMHQEAPISMLYYMAVKKKGGKKALGLSRRFSLIVLQVSLDSDF